MKRPGEMRKYAGMRILPVALAASLAAGCAMDRAAIADPQAVTAATAETVTLAVREGRTTELTIWSPAKPRGIAIFSTGMGSWPERYERAARMLNEEGFVVVAPLHVDSQRSPDLGKFSMQESLVERVADLQASAAYASLRFSGLPTIAVGHSYGALLSMGEGGAFAGMIPMRIPQVRAVLAFSSPARIPGLVTEQAYSTIEVPVMMITGTADTIPAQMGYANTAADHLLPIESTKTSAYAVVVQDADHGLVDDANLLARAAPAIRLFLQGHGLDDKQAVARLTAWKAHAGDEFVVKGSMR